MQPYELCEHTSSFAKKLTKSYHQRDFCPILVQPRKRNTLPRDVALAPSGPLLLPNPELSGESTGKLTPGTVETVPRRLRARQARTAPAVPCAVSIDPYCQGRVGCTFSGRLLGN